MYTYLLTYFPANYLFQPIIWLWYLQTKPITMEIFNHKTQRNQANPGLLASYDTKPGNISHLTHAQHKISKSSKGSNLKLVANYTQ